MEPHSAFNNLDYIVIGVVVLSALLALMRGLVREILSLIAWVSAYIAATKLYPLAVPWAHHYVKADKPAEWTAIVSIFLVTLIIMFIIGHFVCKLVKGRALTAVDRTLGFFYGLVRGAAVVSLVFLCVQMVFWPNLEKDVIDKDAVEQQETENDPKPPEVLQTAKTLPVMAYGAHILKVLVPKEMIDKSLKSDPEKADASKADAQKFIDTIAKPAEDGDSTTASDKFKQILNQESKP